MAVAALARDLAVAKTIYFWLPMRSLVLLFYIAKRILFSGEEKADNVFHRRIKEHVVFANEDAPIANFERR